MAFLAVVVVATPVWADRAAAEKLAKNAHDDAAFVACGQAFLDVYNHDPAAADNDEVLFDAARCFQSGKSISAALQADAMVIKSFPRSKVAAKAIRESGAMYEQIAMYDRAAERLEDYAKRYAGERDAGDALAEAIRLRAALGDAVKQIEDTKLWIRTFGAKRKAEAAAAQLALLSVYDGDDAIALLREYLREFAAVDPNLTIAAHVELADRLRAKACPVHAIDRLCVKVVVDRAPRCGAGTTSVVAVKRAASNREALAEYGAAIALAGTATTKEARHEQAMARLALADDDLEALIATALPHDLDFTRVDAEGCAELGRRGRAPRRGLAGDVARADVLRAAERRAQATAAGCLLRRAQGGRRSIPRPRDRTGVDLPRQVSRARGGTRLGRRVLA